mmetsp:Transcript_28511/g.55636  ORF Transcript_28511/g.55636 Transcript_28511/m.55636 type:complete len:432 (+) Transcript_28511:23-1318(+)
MMPVYRTQSQKLLLAMQVFMVLLGLGWMLGLFSTSPSAVAVSAVRGRQGAIAEDVKLKGGWRKEDFAKPPRMMNVVITGGAGYIGSHMALLLLDQGNYNVTILDNLSRSSISTIERLNYHAAAEGMQDRLHYTFAELEDQPLVTKILKAGSTDLVLHFAGNAYVGESMKFPELYKRNITVTTQHLVDAMLDAKVPYLVYSSSCATYGNVEKLPITELSPQKPISPYGQAKLDAEKAIIKAVKQNPGAFSAVALRYFNVVGVDSKLRTGPILTHKAQHDYPRILDAIFDVVEGTRPKIEIAGDKFPTRDGTAVRDYVHVSDLVAAHLAAFKSFETSTFEAFNIGTGTGLTVKEILAVVEKVTGKTVEKVITEQRPGDASELVSSADKLNKLTGWKAKYGSVSDIVTTQWKWRLKLKREADKVGGKAEWEWRY